MKTPSEINQIKIKGFDLIRRQFAKVPPSGNNVGYGLTDHELKIEVDQFMTRMRREYPEYMKIIEEEKTQ